MSNGRDVVSYGDVIGKRPVIHGDKLCDSSVDGEHQRRLLRSRLTFLLATSWAGRKNWKPWAHRNHVSFPIQPDLSISQ